MTPGCRPGLPAMGLAILYLIILGGCSVATPKLLAEDETAELVEIPGGEHNSLRWTNPEVEQLTIEFFRKHLGGPEPRKP